MLLSKDATWLEETLFRATEEGNEQQPIIVLTHHAPTFDGTSNPRHGRPDLDGRSINLGSFAYCTNMEYLLGGRVRLWCHGHTHFNHDHIVAGTRIVANQRGYPGQQCYYDPASVITVAEDEVAHDKLGSLPKYPPHPTISNPYGLFQDEDAAWENHHETTGFEV